MALDPLPSLPGSYSQLQPLARGAFGQVWQAEHPRFGPVALKLLDPVLGGDPEAAWRFGQEFRRLAALGLDAVPQAFEAGLTEDGTPFFAMALAPGRSPAAPMPLPALRELLASLARALASLHAAGLVHGDLRAENVVVAPDGSVKLVDLALAAPVGASREGLAGTPAYLAPEAWRGGAHAPEVDWYALGVLGTWLATGAFPFEGEGVALIRAHAFEQAPGVAGLPELAALMAKDPQLRVAGIEALGVRVLPPSGLRPAGLLPREPHSPLWHQALAAGGALWLTGPAGSGKTRTLDAWRLEAAASSRAWLAASAADAGPGATMRALLRRALAAARLAPEASAAWLGGSTPEAWRELEPRARRAAVVAVVASELERALARLGPTVIALDDADRADEASRGLLAELCTRPGLADTTWVFAGEVAAAEPVLALAPWHASELLALAEARLGAELPAGLAPALEGLSWPGELERALRQWVATGALERADTGWRFQPGSDSEASPSASPALAALLALAWQAGGLPVAGLAAAGPGWPAELDALVRTGWASVRDGLVRPTDPAGAAAALAWLDAAPEHTFGTLPPGRRALAAHVARTLEAGGKDLAIAARLAVGGDDVALASRLVLRSAEASLEALAVEEAWALLAAAPDDPASRLELAWLRGEAARLVDKLAPAIAAYDEAIPLADAARHAVLAARARIGRAKAHQMQGRYPEALADLARAEADALTLAPLVAARAAVTAARIAFFRGELAVAIQTCERAVTAARQAPGGQAVLASALNLEGALIAELDAARAPEALARLHEALALTEAAGDRLGYGAALENLGNVHLACGELALARDAFAAYEAASASAQSATDRLTGRMNRALALAALGDAEAAALARAVVSEAKERQRPFIEALGCLAAGEAAWRAGAWEAAWEAFDAALSLARTAGNRYAAMLIHVARLEAAGAWNERTRLEAELAAATAPPEAFGPADSPELRTAATLARARQALLARELDQALALATPVTASPNRATAARAHTLAGEVALARGDGEEASHAYQAALAVADGWHARWHQEAAWLGLARAGGAGRQEGWLSKLLDPEAASGNVAARAAAAGLRLAAGRAAGPAGQAALAALPRELALRLAPGQAAATAGAIEPQALAPWFAALGLADDEAGVYDALLEAVLALCAMTRGYLLGYEGGRLANIATRKLDFATELAEGFSTTIADEALFTGEPVYVIDAAGADRFRAAASVVALGLRSVLALPVATATQILGVVYADRTAIDPMLGPADLAQLQALATYAAERALGLVARREAAEAGRWARGVALVAEAAAGAGTPRQLVLEALGRLAGADAGAWLGERGTLAAYGQPPELEPGWRGFGSALDPAGDPRWLACVAAGGDRLLLAGPGAEVGSARLHLEGAFGALAPWLQRGGC